MNVKMGESESRLFADWAMNSRRHPYSLSLVDGIVFKGIKKNFIVEDRCK